MRFKLIMAYDGTNFSGFQVQPSERTVQAVVEKALRRIAKGNFDRIYGSGRTDAGVHARHQVAHFDLPFMINPEALQRALNTLLPDDVTALSVEVVPDDFHAQYHAKEKTYHYRVRNWAYKDPFTRQYSYWHPYSLDLGLLEEGLTVLEGQHDFTSFASTKTAVDNKVREIYAANVWRDEDQKEVVFEFRGNGFLYHQVRVMVGTLLQIGDGRRPIEDISRVLQAKDRGLAGPTAPPEGLILMDVKY